MGSDQIRSDRIRSIDERTTLPKVERNDCSYKRGRKRREEDNRTKAWNSDKQWKECEGRLAEAREEIRRVDQAGSGLGRMQNGWCRADSWLPSSGRGDRKTGRSHTRIRQCQVAIKISADLQLSSHICQHVSSIFYEIRRFFSTPRHIYGIFGKHRKISIHAGHKNDSWNWLNLELEESDLRWKMKLLCRVCL